jgi:hypothetical protein
MSYDQATIEGVLATLIVGQPPPKRRTEKLGSVEVGTHESFYLLATYCFDLSRKLLYLSKVARPFAEHIPPELAHEILEDNDAINAKGLTWEERAKVAEKIMLRLYDELADQYEQILKQAADQVGR